MTFILPSKKSNRERHRGPVNILAVSSQTSPFPYVGACFQELPRMQWEELHFGAVSSLCGIWPACKATQFPGGK